MDDSPEASPPTLRLDNVALHVPDDDQLRQLADLAARPGGVLPRGQEHFVSWLVGREPPDVRRHIATSIEAHRDLGVRPGWTLDLAVSVDGELVGLQALAGFDRWPAVRNVGTSSWLARPAQRRGIGTRARCAVLDLAFDHLGAVAAFSWALPANTASIAVSERLGYRLVDAADPHDPESEAKYRLDARDWRASRPPGVPPTCIIGAEELIGLLGS